MADDPIIRLFHVHKHYGSKSALADISLTFGRGEFVFVTGPSGAGKSTLLKLLYLGTPASAGQILVDGMNLTRIPRKRIPYLRRRFGIIFQDYKLIASRSVFYNIALVLEAAGERSSLIGKKVRHMLRSVGLEKKADVLPPSLSGGEQQKVAVARAMVGGPQIILADEPTGSLDPDSAAIIIGLLEDFHARGGTVIVATHDREMIRRSRRRVIALQDGRLATSAVREAP